MDYPLLLSEQLTPYLKSLRRQRGLSQAELGQMLGVGQARMADIENNPGSVSVDRIMKLLAALDAKLMIRSSSAAASPEVDGTTTRPAASVTDAPAARSVGASKAVASGRSRKSASSPSAKSPPRKPAPKGSW